MIFALAVCGMLDPNQERPWLTCARALPKTWGSPTMAPHCDDEKKYAVVDSVVKQFKPPKPTARKLQGRRSAIWSRSTACA
jgi:phosphomannomutase/phosphoglucomutase